MLLIPREGPLILPPAWTLQHELVFYAIFGLLMLNQRLGLVALALWQIACVLVLVLKLVPENYLLPATTFIGYYNFGFLFGIAIALLRDRSGGSMDHRGPVVGAFGLFGLLTCFVGEWHFGSAMFPSPAIVTLTYFGFYSLTILALLSVENKPRPVLDGTLGVLDAASSIRYLSTYRCSIAFPIGAPATGSPSIPNIPDRYRAVGPARGSNFDFNALWNRTAGVALASPPLPAADLKFKPRTAV